jgi:uncharacterized protein YwlG (UPF0340 family)
MNYWSFRAEQMSGRMCGVGVDELSQVCGARLGVGGGDDVALSFVEVIRLVDRAECVLGASCECEYVCKRFMGTRLEVDKVGAVGSLDPFARDLLGFGVALLPRE